MRRISRTRWSAVAATAVLLAGCGSTVQQRAHSSLADPALQLGDRLAQPSNEAVLGATVPTDGPRTTTGPAGSDPRSDGTYGVTPRRPSPTGPVGNLRTAGPRQPIKIGILVDGGDQCAAFGFECGGDPATWRDWGNVFAQQINKRGGYAGHPITVTVVSVDQTDQSTGTQTRLQNVACARLVQDEHVFMVLSLGTGLTYYASNCYIKGRTPVWESRLAADEAMWQDLAAWFAPAFSLNYSRLARAWPTVMKQANFLTQRMAVITFDTPSQTRSMKGVLIPGISAAGGKVIDTQTIQKDYQSLGAGVSSAVLRFAQKGVDRVVVWATGSGAWYLFVQQARSQQYHPLYAFSTWNEPALVSRLIPAFPSQVVGSLGLGWSPLGDLTTPPAPSARAKACWSTLAAMGTSYSNYSSSDAGPANAAALCEAMWLAEAAFARLSDRSLARPDVTGLYRQLGTSYVPVQYPAAAFADREADALSSYALIRSDGSEFKYASGWARFAR